MPVMDASQVLFFGNWKITMGFLTTLLIGFLSLATLNAAFCNGGCIERERQALLKLKRDMVDPAGRLASWVADDEDCCRWKGVFCNNVTGHVLGLNLQNPAVEYDLPDQINYHYRDEVIGKYDLADQINYRYRDEVIARPKLGGKISPSLLDLKHLCHLDLSNNDFGRITIPKFIGSLRSLKLLNLYNSRFVGMVPHHLGNLSNLKYLSLGLNYGLHVKNFHWLSGLSSLQYLDMSLVNLSKASNWFHVVNTLPSLLELHLEYCQLGPHDQVHPIKNINLSSLDVLDLSYNPGLVSFSNINWVFGLKNLIYLDLSTNKFESSIPYDLQNLTLLRYLDLSYNHFNSSIPNWLEKFSHLEFLDLSYNYFDGKIPIWSIGKLCNLCFLSFSGFSSYSSDSSFFPVHPSLQISSIFEIFSKCISNSLKSLHLDYCQLSGQLTNQLGNFKVLREFSIKGSLIFGPIPTSIAELQSLEVLYLATNHLSGSLPESFGQLANLEYVDISSNSFDGSLPESFGQLANLEYVDISSNSFNGSLPESFDQLANLEYVDISGNSFDGSLPESFGQLVNLEYVDISHNSFEGTILEIHFINLTKLKAFIAHGNPLMIWKVNPNWLPHFQILDLRLGSWHLGPQFPQWLHSLKYLQYLDISDSKISDTVPSWFWEVSAQFVYLNISHNQIHGQLPSVLNIHVIDFSSNNFTYPLACISFKVYFLNLSKNNLSGSLFHFLCRKINESMAMIFLNLGHNFLFGELPDCWTKWPKLKAIVLSNNRLTGGIPRSIGTLPELGSLHLGKNYLSGEIPLSLSNCTKLEILQLSENLLSGSIPTWMGHSLSNLKILDLSSNKFSRHIPNELCSLNSLQILDLAHNNLFGSLPRCIGNISVLRSADNHSREFNHVLYEVGAIVFQAQELYLENAFLLIKGQLLGYDKILHLVKVMDFSSNNLSGEIPSEITYLQGLQSLNLSHNLFIGRIPKNIGNMRMLESVDFSENKLSGSIPESMLSLTFLSYLNLSNNELIGRIPSGIQLQSFNASSYAGNKLCGLPLPDNCSVNGNSIPSIQTRGRKHGTGVEIIWLSRSITLGFIVGFWSVLSPLVISRRWRCMYYQFLEEMWWKISDSVNKCF